MKNNNLDNVIDEIKNMTINDLPDIKLSDADKEKAKKKLFSSIEALKDRNKELNIDITLDEVLDIKDSLGNVGDKNANGVKYGHVIREVALQAADNEVYKSNTVIQEVLANNAYATSNLGWMEGGAIAFKIYLTKTKLIIYSFTEFYKLIEKKEYNLSEIKGIIHHEDGSYSIQYVAGGEISLSFTTAKTQSDLDSLIKELLNLGVKEITKGLFSKENIITFIYIIIILVIMTGFTISKFM